MSAEIAAEQPVKSDPPMVRLLPNTGSEAVRREPNIGSLRLLGRAAGLPHNETVKLAITQQEITDFFELEFFPSFETIRMGRAPAHAPATRARMERQVQSRITDMRAILGGASYQDVAQGTNRSAATVEVSLTKVFKDMRGAGYGPNEVSAALQNMCPNFGELRPEEPREVKPRSSTPRSEKSESPADESFGYISHSSDSVRAYLDRIGKVPLLKAEEEVGLAKRIEAGTLAGIYMGLREDTTGEFAEELMGTYERLATKRLAAGLRGPKRKVAEAMARRQALGQLAEMQKAAGDHPASTRDLRKLHHEGARAQEHLVEANLRLVVFRAKRFYSRGLQQIDLIQEGNLGLIHAAKKFDYTKGYTFANYATWWIDQKIYRAISEKGRAIRLPEPVYQAVRKLDKLNNELYKVHGRHPSLAELAKEMNVEEEKVKELLGYLPDVLELDKPVGKDREDTLLTILQDSSRDDDSEARRQATEVERALRATLLGRELAIVLLSYGLYDGKAWSQREIAIHLGISRQRVQQLTQVAMGRLQGSAQMREFQEFAG